MRPPILAKRRIFDYLEKRGLEKITDVNAGEWHIYILKKLIDNALDADEAESRAPSISIRFAYDRRGALAVSVTNGAEFPLCEVSKILASV